MLKSIESTKFAGIALDAIVTDNGVRTMGMEESIRVILVGGGIKNGSWDSFVTLQLPASPPARCNEISEACSVFIDVTLLTTDPPDVPAPEAEPAAAAADRDAPRRSGFVIDDVLGGTRENSVEMLPTGVCWWAGSSSRRTEPNRGAERLVSTGLTAGVCIADAAGVTPGFRLLPPSK